MSVLVLLIAAGGVVAVGFLGSFIWAVLSGQFDDLATPPVRVLVDDIQDDASPAFRRSEEFHAD
jgi:cbb3-type cytochrome oxidase maturation protein